MNINKAKKILKWKPTYNIKKSVRITVDWYYKVLQEKKSSTVVTDTQIKQYMHDSKIS